MFSRVMEPTQSRQMVSNKFWHLWLLVGCIGLNFQGLSFRTFLDDSDGWPWSQHVRMKLRWIMVTWFMCPGRCKQRWWEGRGPRWIRREAHFPMNTASKTHTVFVISRPWRCSSWFWLSGVIVTWFDSHDLMLNVFSLGAVFLGTRGAKTPGSKVELHRVMETLRGASSTTHLDETPQG